MSPQPETGLCYWCHQSDVEEWPPHFEKHIHWFSVWKIEVIPSSYSMQASIGQLTSGIIVQSHHSKEIQYLQTSMLQVGPCIPDWCFQNVLKGPKVHVIYIYVNAVAEWSKAIVLQEMGARASISLQAKSPLHVLPVCPYFCTYGKK